MASPTVMAEGSAPPHSVDPFPTGCKGNNQNRSYLILLSPVNLRFICRLQLCQGTVVVWSLAATIPMFFPAWRGLT